MPEIIQDKSTQIKVFVGFLPSQFDTKYRMPNIIPARNREFYKIKDQFSKYSIDKTNRNILYSIFAVNLSQIDPQLK